MPGFSRQEDLPAAQPGVRDDGVGLARRFGDAEIERGGEAPLTQQGRAGERLHQAGAVPRRAAAARTAQPMGAAWALTSGATAGTPAPRVSPSSPATRRKGRSKIAARSRPSQANAWSANQRSAQGRPASLCRSARHAIPLLRSRRFAQDRVNPAMRQRPALDRRGFSHGGCASTLKQAKDCVHNSFQLSLAGRNTIVCA